jgi:hypothetical protein
VEQAQRGRVSAQACEGRCNGQASVPNPVKRRRPSEAARLVQVVKRWASPISYAKSYLTEGRVLAPNGNSLKDLCDEGGELSLREISQESVLKNRCPERWPRLGVAELSFWLIPPIRPAPGLEVSTHRFSGRHFWRAGDSLGGVHVFAFCCSGAVARPERRRC